MARRGLEECFAVYGAKLRNRFWAVSALLPDALVLSLWEHYFGRGMVYRDRVSRWSGPGNALFRSHLQDAFELGLPVRLIIARSENPTAVDAGADASGYRNVYSARPDLIGTIDSFDGDAFTITFRQG